MIDVNIRFRGCGSEKQTMPALPPIGCYIRHANRLWLVDDIAFDNGTVNVYAIRVSDSLAAEIMAAWAAWSSPIADAAEENCDGT